MLEINDAQVIPSTKLIQINKKYLDFASTKGIQ